MLFKKITFFQVVFFKNVPKTQILPKLRGKMNQNVIFCVQIFSQKLLFKQIFSSKSCLLKIYFSF